MKPLKVLWKFSVDLVIGDDPKIALAVVSSLVLAGLLLVSGVVGPSVVAVVGAATVAVAFTVSLVVDTRPARE